MLLVAVEKVVIKRLIDGALELKGAAPVGAELLVGVMSI